MTFLVEVQLQPGTKESVMAVFEQRGPNRNPEVKFVRGWIGTRDDVAFVVIESEVQAHVDEACQSWAGFGATKIYPVVDIEQY